MEQRITQQAPSEKAPKVSAVDLVNRIVKGYSSADKDRVPSLLDNVAQLSKMGKASGPSTSALLKKVGEDEDIRAEVIERLTSGRNADEYERTRVNMQLAHLFGMDTDSSPDTQKLINSIEQEHERQKQKRRILNLGSKARVALTMGVLSIVGVPFIGVHTTTPPASAEAKTIPVAAETIRTIQGSQYNIVETAAKVILPPKEERMLYPKELVNSEVTPWIGQLRNSHDSVLSEALFTKEMAAMNSEQREKIMQAIAKASAQALVEHYGNSPTLVGIDPGHGGTDIGSSAIAIDGYRLLEKDLTWQLAQMVSEQIYLQSNGNYFIVMLRPQNPVDLDLDKDGIVSPVERLQKRKALLLQTQKNLEEAFPGRIGQAVFFSLHFNDDQDQTMKGAEVFWPNGVAVASQGHRTSSMLLAQAVQEKNVAAIREAGYPVQDLGAQEDPDKREPGANSDTKTGAFVGLGSGKLDRNLEYGGKK